MSLTQKSNESKMIEQTCMFVSRDNSVSSQKSRRKGISLSKEHDQTERGKSPSFIKVMQKNKRQVVVERRQIKLLLKSRDSEIAKEQNNGKQNRPNDCNIGNRVQKAHMDILSTDGPSGMIKTKEFGKFPLKKQVRKERGVMKGSYQTAQLF